MNVANSNYEKIDFLSFKLSPKLCLWMDEHSAIYLIQVCCG